MRQDGSHERQGGRSMCHGRYVCIRRSQVARFEADAQQVLGQLPGPEAAEIATDLVTRRRSASRSCKRDDAPAKATIKDEPGTGGHKFRGHNFRGTTFGGHNFRETFSPCDRSWGVFSGFMIFIKTGH